MGQNQVILRHQKLTFPRVSGASERASERTGEWPSTYVSILVCSRPQCLGAERPNAFTQVPWRAEVRRDMSPIRYVLKRGTKAPPAPQKNGLKRLSHARNNAFQGTTITWYFLSNVFLCRNVCIYGHWTRSDLSVIDTTLVAKKIWFTTESIKRDG